jgi:hypothetical protein
MPTSYACLFWNFSPVGMAVPADGEAENGPGLNGSSTRLIVQKPGFCEKPGFSPAVSHFSRSGERRGRSSFRAN